VIRSGLGPASVLGSPLEYEKSYVAKRMILVCIGSKQVSRGVLPERLSEK
jgi:hypothetical protein